MSDLLYDRIYQFLSGRQNRLVEAVEPFALGSMIGSIRNRNEDVAVIVNVKHADSTRTDFTLALVCDGMGGMTDGRQAALLAASIFVSHMLGADLFGDPHERLRGALAAAQDAVFNKLRGDGGTTLSALYLDQGAEAWLVHVGDSRIYAITSERVLRQISRDDTIGAALNRENEKRADFNRLIQFIGIDGDLEPQVLSFSRSNCEGFLLTSDGVHNAPPEILSAVTYHAKSGPELVRKLLHLADALGGLDNATAIHVPSAYQPTPSIHAQGKDKTSILATLLCTSGLHDIWITQIGSSIPERLQQSQLVYGESRDRPKAQIPQAKSKGTKKRKPNKSKSEAQRHNELPLDLEKPKAELNFSDDGEELP